MIDPHRTSVSSDPSMQSCNPSQIDVISMHWPDLQMYSDSLDEKNISMLRIIFIL